MPLSARVVVVVVGVAASCQELRIASLATLDLLDAFAGPYEHVLPGT